MRGSQSTVYGPRALAGVIQIFTKQGGDPPETSVSFEGGSYDTFRESLATSGKIGQVDYSLGASRLDTDNARPNNQYRRWNFVGDVGCSAADITQPAGSRLPRRPRNEVYLSTSYLWCESLRTTAEAKFVNAREELNFGGPIFDIEDYSYVNFAVRVQRAPHDFRANR